MIIHKLIAWHLSHRDDPTFYTFQATDAIQWLERNKVSFGSKVRALDLGCGHGIFGAELVKPGCPTTFADEQNGLMPELKNCPFLKVNLDRDELYPLGKYDLVICSNVLEHLAKPGEFLSHVHDILAP